MRLPIVADIRHVVAAEIVVAATMRWRWLPRSLFLSTTSPRPDFPLQWGFVTPPFDLACRALLPSELGCVNAAKSHLSQEHWSSSQ